jgi:hypothetical protein
MSHVDDAATIEKSVLNIDPLVSHILCVGWNQHDANSVWIGQSEASSSHVMHDLTIDSNDLDSYQKREIWLSSAVARVFSVFYRDELISESTAKRIWRFIFRLLKSR